METTPKKRVMTPTVTPPKNTLPLRTNGAPSPKNAMVTNGANAMPTKGANALATTGANTLSPKASAAVPKDKTAPAKDIPKGTTAPKGNTFSPPKNPPPSPKVKAPPKPDLVVDSLSALESLVTVPMSKANRYRWKRSCDPLRYLTWDPKRCGALVRPIHCYCPIEHASGPKTDIPKQTPYRFSRRDADACIFAGIERCVRNRRAGKKNKIYATDPDVTESSISVQGVMGELAFCHLFHLPIPVFDTTPRNYMGDIDQDARMPDGSTVDVKTSVPTHRMCVGVDKKLNPADYYSLMVFDMYWHYRKEHLPSLTFRGIVPQSHVFYWRNGDDTLDGIVDNYWVNEEKLFDWEGAQAARHIRLPTREEVKEQERLEKEQERREKEEKMSRKRGENVLQRPTITTNKRV